jgi:hypothetical protein
MRDAHGSGWRVRSLASIERRRARTCKAGIAFFAAKPPASIADPSVRSVRANSGTWPSKLVADVGAKALSASHDNSKEGADGHGCCDDDPLQRNDPWFKAASDAGHAVLTATCKSFVDASTQTADPTTLRLEEALPAGPPSWLTLPDPGCWPPDLGACLGLPLQPPDENRRSYDLDFAEVWDTFASHESILDRMHRRFEALEGYVAKAVSEAVSQLTGDTYMKSINDNTATLVTGVHNLLQSRMSNMQLAIDKLNEMQGESASIDSGTSPASLEGALLEDETSTIVTSGLLSAQALSPLEPDAADFVEKDEKDASLYDLLDTLDDPLQGTTMECSVLSVGDTVLANGLANATHLNNLVGVIEGYHEASERYEVRFAPQLAPSLIRACNLMHPARCPHCSSEITGSRCFACPSGELVMHNSLRTCTLRSDKVSSHNSHTHMDVFSAASQTPEGPGSHSGDGLQMHVSNDQHEDT